MLKQRTAVESFSLCLSGFSDILAAESPVERLEELMLARLDRPVRLLRWAVMRVAEDGSFQVEGACLR